MVSLWTLVKHLNNLKTAVLKWNFPGALNFFSPKVSSGNGVRPTMKLLRENS